jgi:hypothetical protein
MRIQDLDREPGSGKHYYWKMKFERAKMDRKKTNSDEATWVDALATIFYLIGLVFTTIILINGFTHPSPIWMLATCGGFWFMGSVIKCFSPHWYTLGTIWGFINGIATLFLYLLQYGMI